MARSSVNEPVERFRFQVTFFGLTANRIIGGTANVSQVVAGTDTGTPEFDNPFRDHLKDDNAISAGFTSITPPRFTVNEINYRENIDMLRTTKQPGLITYEPVTLKRGVTKNKQLYNWYKKVHNDAYSFNSANEILADQNIVPVFPVKFRKEMLISSIDREGKGIRHWLCLNAFPVSYKGADNFDASDEGKLIEEMVITYEACVELIGNDVNEAIQDVLAESIKAAVDAGTAAVGGAVLGAAFGAIDI